MSGRTNRANGPEFPCVRPIVGEFGRNFWKKKERGWGDRCSRQEYRCEFVDAEDAVFREADVLASLARGVTPLSTSAVAVFVRSSYATSRRAASTVHSVSEPVASSIRAIS